MFPVYPGDLVVLAVGVVIPFLCAAQLIAGYQHRHALRQEQRSQQIPLLAVTQGNLPADLCRTFLTTVPRAVVRLTVVIVLAVRLVVFFHYTIPGRAA